MTPIVYFQAVVDFGSDLPLADVAHLIAIKCFGGGHFVGENTGILDEVPAVRLDPAPLDLEVILGGQSGDHGYTLEVMSRESHGDELLNEDRGGMVGCFSSYLAALLAQIPQIRNVQPEE